MYYNCILSTYIAQSNTLQAMCMLKTIACTIIEFKNLHLSKNVYYFGFAYNMISIPFLASTPVVNTDIKLNLPGASTSSEGSDWK